MAELTPAARQKLELVLAELQTTEAVYVEALAAFSQHYLPLLGDASAVFTTVGSLHGVHRELLGRLQDATDLQHRLDEAEPEASSFAFEQRLWQVSEAFGQLAPFLRMYSIFCAGYTSALATLGETRQRCGALRQLEAARAESLESVLIRPVQRLCKYPLFFAELLRPLPDGELHRELAAAADAVREVSEEVNRKTRGTAEAARLVEIHMALGQQLPSLLAPTRSLLLETQVRLASTRIGRRHSLGAISGLSAGLCSGASKRHLLVLLSDVLLVIRVSRRQSRRLVTLGARSVAGSSPALKPSTTPTTATPSQRGSGYATLKLKAALPLQNTTVEAAPASLAVLPGRRRTRRCSSGGGTGSSCSRGDDAAASSPTALVAAPSPSAALLVQCPPRRPQHAARTYSARSLGASGLLTECSPVHSILATAVGVQYTCIYDDATSAASMLQAARDARAKCEDAARGSRRRTSLIPEHARSDASAGIEEDRAEHGDSDDDTGMLASLPMPRQRTASAGHVGRPAAMHGDGLRTRSSARERAQKPMSPYEDGEKDDASGYEDEDSALMLGHVVSSDSSSSESESEDDH